MAIIKRLFLWGSRPIRIAIVVGTTLTKRVMNRLIQTLNCFPNSPSIKACPDKVPTTDDAIPDESSVSRKIVPAAPPNSGTRVLYASDIEAMPELSGKQQRTLS